jgi:hypothetical protein
MLKKIFFVCGLWCLVPVLPAAAQEPATIVLRSGERISGELVDLGGIGFTMRVNGQDRQVDPAQVAVVEFTKPDEARRLRATADRAHIVLRNGDIVEGRLYDIGGTRPLRITVDTPSGQRNFTSSEVAEIHYANSVAVPVATAGRTAEAEVPAGDLRVDANRPWTDTGITVRRGAKVTFNGRGDIMLAAGISSGVNGTTAVSSANYPLKSAPAGALIGRVGTGQPFMIGSQTEVTMPANGRLMLGVNDDHHADNTGVFAVGIAPQAAIRR